MAHIYAVKVGLCKCLSWTRAHP